MRAGGGGNVAGEQAAEDAAAAAADLDFIDAVIDETQADMAAHEGSVDEHVRSEQVLKRAVECAGMLADAHSVEDALVAGPVAETALAADELESALRHLSQCSHSQQAASQLASQTLSHVVAGPAGAADLSPQTQGALSGGVADVPTPSTASTLPAAAPVPAESPAPPDCEPCGLKPLQAGVIKALRTSLNNKRPGVWEPAAAADSRRGGADRRRFASLLLQHLALAAEGWTVAYDEQAEAARAMQAALQQPDAPAQAKGAGNSSAGEYVLVLRQRPEYLSQSGSESSGGGAGAASKWSDAEHEYRYVLLLSRERPCSSCRVWERPEQWWKVLLVMLESQLTSMSERFNKFAVNELAGGLHAGVPDAVHRGDESNLRQRGE